MLIRFDSEVGRITLFGDVAVQLLRMMGHSGTVPGALLAPEIPAAVARLKQALAEYREPPPKAKSEKEWDEEPPVPIQKRAFPLIQLFEQAARADSAVMWSETGLEL